MKVRVEWREEHWIPAAWAFLILWVPLAGIAGRLDSGLPVRDSDLQLLEAAVAVVLIAGPVRYLAVLALQAWRWRALDAHRPKRADD